MELFSNKKNGTQLVAIAVSLVALTTFLHLTHLLFNPLLLILISIFLIAPFRKESQFSKRLLFLILLLFALWIFSDLGFALLPFFVAILVCYLLNPLIDYLESKNIPRWLSSLTVDLVLVGIVAGIAFFVFPVIFDQIDDAINTISNLLGSMSTQLKHEDIYAVFKQFGISKQDYYNLVDTEFVPRLQGFVQQILKSLQDFFSDISGIGSKIINIIIVPILIFYILKDYNSILSTLERLLEQKNRKLLFDLKRIDIILRRYIGWQITAAMIIGTSCSISFSLFNVPYPIVLGSLCGILNPIPYIGIFASMIAGVVTIILVNPPNMMQYILVIVLTISAMHFINAYFLEPNIVGKQVGVHPVLLIASLFVFGGLFGIVGLLIAVPLTATLMMFFKDWMDVYISPRMPQAKEDDEPYEYNEY